MMNMNATYQFNLCEFIPLFKELYKDWFKANGHFDHEKYMIFINDSEFVYNNELVHETHDVQIGAIIGLNEIKSVQRPQSHNMYSQCAAMISTGLLNLFGTDCKIGVQEWCIIFKPFLDIHDKEMLPVIMQMMIDSKDSAYSHILTDIHIQMQKHTHKIKNNSYNLWQKYGEILQHIPSDPIVFGIDHKHYVIKQFQKNLKLLNKKNTNIILSISGQVDSCVCLYLIKQMLPLHDIVAIFFDTPSGQDVLSFVKKYCAVINVKFYHRKIHDFEHSHEQEIKTDTYKKLANSFENNQEPIIVLGNNMDHNFTDIMINISTKTMHRCNLNILNTTIGMPCFRPLLNVRKSEILIFAIHMNIPYIKKNEPYWTTSAKIRDVVLPAMQNINTNIIGSYIFLKEYIQSADDIVADFVKAHLLDKFESTGKNSLKATFKDNMHLCNLSIWLKIFSSDLFKSFLDPDNIVLSNKAIGAFICFIKRCKKRSTFVLHQRLRVLKDNSDDSLSLEFIIS